MAVLDYEVFEKQVEEIQKENKKLLATFENWLKHKGLTEKTIHRHIDNVEFYIDEYLCYYDPPTKAKDGWHEIDSFLGDWFVRKTTWASPTQVKSNAASIKKFYACMLEEYFLIDKSEYKELSEMIKSQLPDWMENAEFDEDDYFDVFYL